MSDLDRLRKTEAFAIASAFYQGTLVVSEFVRSWVRTLIAPVEERDSGTAVISGQLLRVDAWLRSICKLDEPGDVQAIAAACRALFETAIDIALIYQEPQNWERLVAWEDSAEHRNAQAIAAFLARAGIEPEEDLAIAVAVAGDEERKRRMDARRKAFNWVNGDRSRHPNRWTDRTLLEDAKRADASGWPFRFEYFYETEYRRVCGLVHGSAFPLRRVPPELFPAIAGFLLPNCANLGMVASEIVIKHLGLWSAECERAFAVAARRRQEVTLLTERALTTQTT